MYASFHSLESDVLSLQRLIRNKPAKSRIPVSVQIMLSETKCTNIYVCVIKNAEQKEYVYVCHIRRVNGQPKRFNICCLGSPANIEKLFGYDLENLRKVLKMRKSAAYFKALMEIAKNYIKQKVCNYKCTPKSQFIKNYSKLFINDFFDTFELSTLFNHVKNKNLQSLIYSLITQQLLEPCSKRQFISNSQDYIMSNRKYSGSLIHRSLKIIESKKEEIFKLLNQKLITFNILDPEQEHTIFFDITNFYTEKTKETELAKRGHSKENRTTPIYQVALFITDKLIPLAMYVYPGNMADCKILKPAVTQFMEHTRLKKFTLIADKAFNTAENIHFISQYENMHYIFSSKCKGTRTVEDIRDHINENSPWKDQEAEPQKDEFTRSSYIRNRTVEGEEVTEKVVCEWSHNKAKLEIEQREAYIQRVQDMTPQQLYGKNTINLNTKYCDVEVQDRKGERIKNAKMVKMLNEDKIEQDRLRDGINTYVTDLLDLSDDEISYYYRKQANIENSFSILKSALKTRPFYLHDDKCIIAHILICFLALFFIQIVGNSSKGKVTVKQLQKTFRNLTGTYNGRSFFDVHSYKPYVKKTLTQLGIVINEHMKTSTIKLGTVYSLATGWTKTLLETRIKNLKERIHVLPR